jgi:hypothetical protein
LLSYENASAPVSLSLSKNSGRVPKEGIFFADSEGSEQPTSVDYNDTMSKLRQEDVWLHNFRQPLLIEQNSLVKHTPDNVKVLLRSMQMRPLHACLSDLQAIIKATSPKNIIIRM